MIQYNKHVTHNSFKLKSYPFINYFLNFECVQENAWSVIQK